MIVESLAALHNSIFGDSANLHKQLKSKTKLLINIAFDDTKVVGYKIGYEIDKDTFYSWLGGVDPQYRNDGVATKLMEKQHHYLKENRYKKIKTKTKNKWRSMLILNIKCGFDVHSTYTDKEGELKIILEKNLLN